MSKNQKIIAIALGVIATAAIVATVFITVKALKTEEPVAETPTLDCPMTNGVVTYSGEDGKTALELLAAICEIETRETAEGAVITVTAIDGIAATAPDYWAFYVNDKPALSSPNQIKTVDTDTIEWQLESVGN